MRSGCVGEGGMHACPPPSRDFLAFGVTLKSLSQICLLLLLLGLLGMPRAVLESHC